MKHLVTLLRTREPEEIAMALSVLKEIFKTYDLK